MSKVYTVELTSEQLGLILKVVNLRGNQLMSRHTRGADWELGQLDSLTDYLSESMISQNKGANYVA
jgi:hypothetical protein